MLGKKKKKKRLGHHPRVLAGHACRLAMPGLQVMWGGLLLAQDQAGLATGLFSRVEFETQYPTYGGQGCLGGDD